MTAEEPRLAGFDVQAYLNIGCDSVPVYNGQVIKTTCIPLNANENSACFWHVIGGSWNVLHAVSQHISLEVTATDAFGNEASCSVTICGDDGIDAVVKSEIINLPIAETSLPGFGN